MVLAQNRNTEQWKRTEKAEINPHTYNQSMTKVAILYKGEMTFSSIDGAGKTEQLHVKNEIRTFFNSIYKTKLKMA